MNRVELKIITTPCEQSYANEIIIANHSYVPTVSTVGRHIDYLIYYDNRLCGMIGVGSATYPPCKDILRYIGMTKNEYRDNFNSFCNNWKFCISNKYDKNLGTMALKQLRNRCKDDWYLRYGDELKYIFTFVGADKRGSVYLADNWECIGYTSGLPSHKSVSMKWDIGDLDSKFVKPTGENRKLIFIKELPKPIKCSRPTLKGLI